MHVDVRVIAATNRDLAADGRRRARSARTSTTGSASSRSRCRRCASAPATSRSSSRACSRRSTATSARTCRYVTPAALARLTAYRWPGNVRELENMLTRAVVLAKTDVLDETLLADRRRVRPTATPPRTGPRPTPRARCRRCARSSAGTSGASSSTPSGTSAAPARSSTSVGRPSIARSRSTACAGTRRRERAALHPARDRDGRRGVRRARAARRAAPRDNLVFGLLTLTDAAMTAWRAHQRAHRRLDHLLGRRSCRARSARSCSRCSRSSSSPGSRAGARWRGAGGSRCWCGRAGALACRRRSSRPASGAPTRLTHRDVLLRADDAGDLHRGRLARTAGCHPARRARS